MEHTKERKGKAIRVLNSNMQKLSENRKGTERRTH